MKIHSNTTNVSHPVFFSKSRGKKKRENVLLPTYLNNSPSQLYVITSKKKNEPPLLDHIKNLQI